MKDGWDKTKDLAQIVSLIAVPVLVAFFGWQIQQSVSDREIRRDYVQIAVQVLSAPESDHDLRTWAGAVIQTNSPVPFGDTLDAKVSSGSALFSFFPSIPSLPDIARQPERTEECEPFCITRWANWQEEAIAKMSATAPGDEGAIDLLADLLSNAVKTGNVYASLADRSRIAGLACERAYDLLR